MRPNLTILLTGASGGLGLHTMRRLLERGHSVIAGIRGGEARLGEALGADLARFQGRVWAIDLHVDRPDTFVLAKEAVGRHFGGKLDVLVNNAGYGLFGAVEDQSDSQIRRQLEVNTIGPIGLTRALLPEIRAAQGRIVNVSSIAAFCTVPLYGAYCASKAALEAFSEGLYYDLRSEGIQVGMLEPGGFRTNFIHGAKDVAQGTRGKERTEGLFRLFEKMDRSLPTVDGVGRKLVRLCEKPRIPLRTLSGTDAYFVYFLMKFMPRNLRVRFQAWLFSRLIRN
jgi:NAD(P)-dependent dehydrogenase (short-subunit alcohol dehydrogenase family)